MTKPISNHLSMVDLKDTQNIKEGTLDNGGGPPHDGNMDARLTALETRFDAVLPTLATKADMAELRADVHKINAEIKGWTLATMITIIGTMLAAIFGISQIYKSTNTPQAPAQQSSPIIINVPAASPPAAAPPNPPHK